MLVYFRTHSNKIEYKTVIHKNYQGNILCEWEVDETVSQSSDFGINGAEYLFHTIKFITCYVRTCIIHLW